MSEHTNNNNDGDWEVARTFNIPGLSCRKAVDLLSNIVGEEGGVVHIATDMDKHSLTVTYDLRKVQFDTIIKHLKDMGLPTKQSWWLHFRRSWYRFTESNMSNYAKAPKSACCNKAPIRTRR